MRPAISVIIPIYNTNTEYFKQCLDSILSSSFPDYEIIVVDDGSSEENKKQIDAVCAVDDRIKVFHQENQGVSVARNNAVSHAEGKYIVFVDADDMITPYFFENAYKIAEEKQADILYGFNYSTTNNFEYSDAGGSPFVKPADNEWLEKYTVGFLYTNGKKTFGRGPWARFINSKVLQTVKFLPGVPIGEDVLWNLEVMQIAKKKYIVDQVWYIYIQRPDSVTHVYNESIGQKLLPFYKYLAVFYENRTGTLKYYYHRMLRDLKKYMYEQYTAHPTNPDSFIARWKTFNRICSNDPWKDIGKRAIFFVPRFRTKVKIILFKLKLLFPVWNISDSMTKNK